MGSKLTAAVFALPIVLAAGPAAADEAVFHDGFELGELCSWSSAPAAAVVVETAAANDAAASAQSIARCAVVDGAIAAVAAGAADFDFYRLVVDRPTLLRLTLAARDETSDFEPYADLDDDDPATLPLGLTPLAVEGSTTRQVLLPAAGAWYVLVGDERNWDRASLDPVDSPLAGGASATYRLTLAVEPLAGQFAFATTGEPLEIPADGALVLYQLSAGQTDSLDLVEVYAERLGSPSPLDAKLYLIADPAGAPAILAACDDQTTGGCAAGDFVTVDPRLETVALGPTVPHLVVVDFYDVYDPGTLAPQALPAPFELDLQFLTFSGPVGGP